MAKIQIVDTIIFKQNKILMVIRNFEPAKGKLDLPGGFVEENESIEDAAKRETKEETGLDVELTAKLGEFDYFDRQEKTSNAYIGKIIGGQITSSIEGKPIWVDIDKIEASDLSFPTQFLPILSAFKKSKHFVENK